MAKNVLEELVSIWTIEADLTPLEQGRKALTQLGTVFAGVAATVGAGAATLFGIAHSVAEIGEEAGKAAQKFGILTSAYQAMAQAAYMGDLSTEEFNMSLQFLSRNAEGALKAGSEQAKSFQALGVAVRDASGQVKSADRLMLEISDRIKAMPPGIQKTALAMDIFGRSGAKMIPFLNKGSAEIRGMMEEAEEMGLILSEDTIKASDEFNDNLKLVYSNVRGIKNILGAELIPVINEVIASVLDWVKANRAVIIDNLRNFLLIITVYIRRMWQLTVNLAKGLDRVVKLFGGWLFWLKAVATLLAIIFGAGTLIALGGIGIALGGIITSLGTILPMLLTMASSALVAAAPFLAIGAAIAFVLLAIEDLVTFMNGGDSVFGDFVNLFWDMANKLSQVFAGIGDSIMSVLSGWAEKARIMIMNVFQPVVDVLNWIGKALSGMNDQALMGGLKSGWGKVASLWGGGTAQAASAPGGAPAMGNVMGITPNYSTAIGGDASKNMKQSTVINQNIVAGDGASALETGKAVGQATNNVMNQQNARAARTFSAQGDY